MDRLLPSVRGLRFPNSHHTWGQERLCRYLATALLNQVGDINLGIHDFSERPPVGSP
jgi:hypothetical protein